MTKKKHTEIKLREQREQYKSIFNAISDAAIIYVETGTIVEANPTATEVYGYTYEELIGRNASDFFQTPDDFIALKEIALSGREYSGVHNRKHKDGSAIRVEFKGFGLYSEINLMSFLYPEIFCLNAVRKKIRKARTSQIYSPVFLLLCFG